MKLVKGFSLIEVMIAMVISVGLSTILFQSLSQSNTVFQRVVTFSGLERKMTIIQQVWDREISGIFIPTVVWDEKLQNQDEEGGAKESPEEKKDEKDSKKDVNNTDKKDEKKDEKVPQSFVYETDEIGNLKMFTFITANATTMYGEPQVRMSRIMYRLEPDKENSGEFLLTHQQSEKLDPKRFIPGSHNGIRGYQILGGIKSMKLEFLLEKQAEKPKDQNKDKKEEPAQPEKKDSKDAKKEEPKKVRMLEVLKDWKEEKKEDIKTDEKKSDKKDAKEVEVKKEEPKRPELPLFIHITLTIFDDVKKVHTYDYWYAPQYDIEKGTSEKSTGLPKEAERKGSKLAFEDHQKLLKDAGGKPK